MKKTTGKLVRDKIPAIIRKTGRTPVISILPEKQMLPALQLKFIEEFEEFRQAAGKQEQSEELADILEVIFSTGKLLGFSEKRLIALCHDKRKKRGAFKKGYLYRGDKSAD